MFKPFRVAIGVLAALAVVASGCGSTKTAKTASAPTAASAGTGTTGPTSTATQPATRSTQTTTRSTSSKQAPQPSKAPPQSPETTAEKAPLLGKRPEPKAPPKGKYDYPLEVQRGFMGICQEAHGSKASCECMLVKYESRKVVEGQSLAELLGVELAVKDHIRLARRARKYAKDCASAIRTQ